ncbi:MAG: uracil-DNA glycosylase family protein [Pseudomonadota bacterium]
MSDPRADIAACTLCADRFSATETRHAPRPVVWFSSEARILIAGQAPGLRVHKSGKPFDDPSGTRLRVWLGVDEETFYDRLKVAIVPMAFCFPGYDAKGADLPPPSVCAQTWREKVTSFLPKIRLRIVVGGYAMKYHLGRAPSVTQAVSDWRDKAGDTLVLPHPSWRNTGWLKKNPWFDTEVVPRLQKRVKEVLNEG